MLSTRRISLKFISNLLRYPANREINRHRFLSHQRCHPRCFFKTSVSIFFRQPQAITEKLGLVGDKFQSFSPLTLANKRTNAGEYITSLAKVIKVNVTRKKTSAKTVQQIDLLLMIINGEYSLLNGYVNERMNEWIQDTVLQRVRLNSTIFWAKSATRITRTCLGNRQPTCTSNWRQRETSGGLSSTPTSPRNTPSSASFVSRWLKNGSDSYSFDIDSIRSDCSSTIRRPFDDKAVVEWMSNSSQMTIEAQSTS